MSDDGVENLVNIKRVAEYLQVHEQTVYAYASSGRIPAYKVGNRWRFDLDEVKAVLAAGRDPWALPSGRRRR